MNDAAALTTNTPHMRAEIDGPIGWMNFNKPARRNAVSLDMWEAIPVILDRFESDPGHHAPAAARAPPPAGAGVGAGPPNVLTSFG